MRIAFIANSFPSLSETFILDQVTGLMDLGHEVDIFAFRDPREGKVHKQVEEYNLRDRARYLRGVKYGIWPSLRALSWLLKNLQRTPWPHIVYLKRASYLIPFLDKEYDIVHAHFGPVGRRFVILKRLLGARFITTFHGYDVSRTVRQKGRDFYKGLFAGADLLLAVSLHVKERLIELGCNPGKIVKHPVGVELSRFRFSERRLQEGETIRLLTVARLTEKKGLEFSIKAVARVLQEHANLEYSIVGDGPLRMESASLIARLNAEREIRLLGPKTRSEVIELLGGAHIFILASTTAQDGDEEGLPLVLQEAQAAGLPIISTLHAGIPEGVVDGKAGFLVPEGDVDALHSRLDYLIKHPEIWPNLGRFGRTFVEKRFDQRSLNKRLEEIYRELLPGRNC